MAKPIKNICIVYRPHSDRATQMAREVARWLSQRKLKLFALAELKPIPLTKTIRKNSEISSLDLVVVLGGDGTFLRAVRFLEGRPVPILGVNLGNLGFLTETRVDELYDVLDMALHHRMQRVERAMLQCTILHKTGKKDSYLALNDVVVERGPYARIIDLSIHAGPFLVSTVRADGLIVATPTGSTAYCLAAGGPIVQPKVKAVTITPICPHTLTNRPVIISDDQTLRIRLNQHPESAVLMTDGVRREDLTSDDILMITKSKRPAVMLSLPTRNYFDVVRSKLKFGERE